MDNIFPFFKIRMKSAQASKLFEQKFNSWHKHSTKTTTTYKFLKNILVTTFLKTKMAKISSLNINTFMLKPLQKSLCYSLITVKMIIYIRHNY